MDNNIKSLIKNIDSKKLNDANTNFKSVMAQKISTAFDSRKIELAKGIISNG